MIKTLTAEAEVLKCKMAQRAGLKVPMFRYTCLVIVSDQHFYIQTNEHHKRGAIVEFELGQFEDILIDKQGKKEHYLTRFNGLFGGKPMAIEMQNLTGQQFINLLEREAD